VTVDAGVNVTDSGIGVLLTESDRRSKSQDPCGPSSGDDATCAPAQEPAGLPSEHRPAPDDPGRSVTVALTASKPGYEARVTGSVTKAGSGMVVTAGGAVDVTTLRASSPGRVRA
jgi:hypothetical protein